MTPGEHIDSYYSRTRANVRNRPALDGVVETSACVIGGGLAGIATALGLAERGHSVVLLEANRLGWGASGRNGGFLSPGYALGTQDIEAKVGLENARELYQMSADAVDLVRQRAATHNIDSVGSTAGAVRNSWLDNPDKVKAGIGYLNQRYGTALEYWPRDHAREMYLSPRYHDAVFNPHAYQLHGLDYANGCAIAAEAIGAVIHEQSPVRRIAKRGDRHRVITPDGEVLADNVVFCCSGHIGWLNQRLSWATLPIGTYVLLTEPLGDRMETAIRAPYAAADNRRIENYYRPLPDTRLLWGGGMSIARRPADLEVQMLEDLFSVYPQLRGIRAETAWAGTMGYARHRMPQIGQLSPGLWYNQGYGGHGLNTTTLGGELIARAIAEDDRAYQAFTPFGLDFTGGPVGLVAAQMVYWSWKLQDAWDARQRPPVGDVA
jgi:gamma-glutamylputrescine oxidase